MLTIQNYNKILNKTLGKKNFYVERIEERLLYNPYTFSPDGKYVIEITNRRYSVTVTLDRTPITQEQNYYTLLSSNGNHIYLKLFEIKNIDIFLDKIRFVGID